MHKPIKFTDYPKEISPIINFVKLVKKYEKKSKFSFAEIMAAIPDYVIELGLDNVTNYFENNKFNYYKNKMITNSLTKRIKHKKISKTDLNRAWWDRLSSNWQNLLLKNYELQPMFKTWFHPYFSYYPISIYSLHETETPIYDEPISDKLIAKIKEIRFLDCKYMHIKNLIPIKGFEKLEYLDCSHNELKNLDAIKNLKNLKHLNSCFCPYLKNIEGISDLKGLQIMILHDLPTLKRTTIPSTFNQIKILSVGSSPIEFTQETAENIIELCIREINLPLYNYKKLDIMKLTKEEDDAEIFSSETFLTIKTNRDTEIQQRKVSIFDGLRSMGINENDMLELMLAFKNKIWDSLNFSRVENIFKKYEDPNAKSLWVDGGDCPPMDVMEYDKEK
ncbi:MAG: hypothetical protein B6I20_08155 [Bacteroidetes bacterium 4572_117]|nr:MAG: hypothetical protein B6I20_08155 [Bacteroidetes bacterium 4572_117]